VSKLGTFLRTCPSCGNRFHVKLVDEKVLSDKKEVEHAGKGGPGIYYTASARQYGGAPRGVAGSPPMGQQEKGIFIVERKEFEDSYKCGHCGHQWSEKRVKESGGT